MVHENVTDRSIWASVYMHGLNPAAAVTSTVIRTDFSKLNALLKNTN